MVPLDLIGSCPIPPAGRRAKRLLDLVVALPLLVLVAPLLAGLAALIRMETNGPALFRQARFGEGGRVFALYKLRTMHAESPLPTQGSHKMERDPRVTRLGRVLRRTSLDELPQLWNVACGDVSLVGPRPELPEFAFVHYEPRTWRRLAVPPGLTGRWQVEGRHLQPMYAHPELDLAYVESWSFAQDLRLILRTPGAVFQGRGAY
jgi:lipopolysaccharide/colanic/teichoic acid biosynthesis glycosyltransferase